MGDCHYNDEEGQVHTACHLSDHFLVTTKSDPYPHTDDGVSVRRVLHRLRSTAIEPFNGLFKNVFEWGDPVPVKGLQRVRLDVLGAMLLYRLVLLYQSQAGLPLGKDVKALLRAA